MKLVPTSLTPERTWETRLHVASFEPCYALHRRGGNRLKHPTVLSHCKTGAAFEEFPEESQIFIANSLRNFVGGAVTGFEKPLRFFDANILHIVDDRRSGRGRETAFETALGNVACRHGGGNRIWLAEMFAKPILGLTDDRVRVRLTPDKARIRHLAFAVPLQQIHLGDMQSFARAAVARNDVNRQVMPGGRSG